MAVLDNGTSLSPTATPLRPAWAAAPLLAFMLATDLGFLGYWLLTALHALPPAWLFKDYDNPILQAWNWSFLSLDLVVSVTGILAVTRLRAGRPGASMLALVSLTATSASGLMALSFWIVRRDFDLGWWAPNLFLLVYPIAFLRRFVNGA
jgi:hypothetical protein